MKYALAVIALIVLLPGTADAQHAPASGEAAHHATNHGAVYLGLTVDHDAFFTLGAEYSRRQPEWKAWGGTAFLELIFASDVEFLIGATVNYYLQNLVFETGPGLLLSHGTEFFWRIGAGYQIQAATLTYTPKAYIDFIAGTTLFGFGVAIGRGF